MIKRIWKSKFMRSKLEFKVKTKEQLDKYESANAEEQTEYASMNNREQD